MHNVKSDKFQYYNILEEHAASTFQVSLEYEERNPLQNISNKLSN